MILLQRALRLKLAEKKSCRYRKQNLALQRLLIRFKFYRKQHHFTHRLLCHSLVRSDLYSSLISLTFDAMKLLYLFFFIIFFTFTISCKKTSFITSSDALLFTSTDTLHFDTVF